MAVAGSDLNAPVLLLAMPQVLDPFFHHSVVLLLHHEDQGSFGFIVNRPTGIKVREILQGMDVGWNGGEAAVAYFGGPVQPQLGTVLFAPALSDTGPEDTATEVVPGVALTQHIGDLSRLAEAPPDRFRACVTSTPPSVGFSRKLARCAAFSNGWKSSSSVGLPSQYR